MCGPVCSCRYSPRGNGPGRTPGFPRGFNGDRNRPVARRRRSAPARSARERHDQHHHAEDDRDDAQDFGPRAPTGDGPPAPRSASVRARCVRSPRSTRTRPRRRRAGRRTLAPALHADLQDPPDDQHDACEQKLEAHWTDRSAERRPCRTIAAETLWSRGSPVEAAHGVSPCRPGRARPGTPPAGSRPCPPSSCASCRPSASRAACACGVMSPP